ncbi:multidrug transporter subunit MdtJ, partial [Morganella morganii]
GIILIKSGTKKAVKQHEEKAHATV